MATGRHDAGTVRAVSVLTSSLAVAAYISWSVVGWCVDVAASLASRTRYSASTVPFVYCTMSDCSSALLGISRAASGVRSAGHDVCS